MRGLFAFLFVFIHWASAAQTCTAPGQNPSTAFPVCGTSTFTQTSVPICGGRPMPYTGCGPNSGLTDVNPFWYKFTCFTSGTLGFLITPNTLNEDYDWELYNITGRNPDDVYTDGNLVISNNWSGETGLTGASASGTQTFVCGGSGKPLFSRMPPLQAGQNYLLLVSHFSNSQSGYRLSFGGGTAVITDPTEPHLQKAEAVCSGDAVRLKISKKIKCSSIAPGGSDFYITGGATTVSGAVGINCATQFDADSLALQLSTVLAPGNYTLHIKKGADNNTLLDYCDRPIAETETLPFTVYPKLPTPMDSLAPLACNPSQLKLVFSQPILCSSIAANGSDFLLNGSYPVNVVAAQGVCASGTTKEIILTLSQGLNASGSFTLVLQAGTDGNTLLNECTEQTPAGSSLSFSLKGTVDATFGYAVYYGCKKDTVRFTHPALYGENSWSWSLDEGQQSNLQNPEALYAVFNDKKITLIVSNGFCKDTSEQTVSLKNFLKAGFTAYEDGCPDEPVVFTSTSQGLLVRHAWDFGDGATALGTVASHSYSSPPRQTSYTVTHTITDSFGCTGTAQQKLTIYSSCYLAVPTAFTPNGDGKNDVFGVANAVKAQGLEFVVYNRWGQVVFKTTNWKQGWDGRVAGTLQPTGVFVWFLRYTDRDSKKRMEQKGTVALIR